MNKEQAVTYLKFSGFSDEQIKAIEGAFSCPSAGVDCEDCPAYEKKTGKWIKSDAVLIVGYADTENYIKLPAQECSMCHKPHIRGYMAKYCPNCGAEMAESEVQS